MADNTLHTHNQHETRWSDIHIRTVLSTVSATLLPLLTTHDLTRVLPLYFSLLLALFISVSTMACNALHSH